MKVTIDATDSLSDTIRIINALYGVTLAQVDDDGDTAVPAAPGTRTPKPTASSSTRANPKSSNQPARSNRSKSAPPAASASAIRDWARGNGHVVSNRGTIPAAIRAAFEEAQ